MVGPVEICKTLKTFNPKSDDFLFYNCYQHVGGEDYADQLLGAEEHVQSIHSNAGPPGEIRYTYEGGGGKLWVWWSIGRVFWTE